MLTRTRETIGPDGSYVPQALNIFLLGLQVEHKWGHFLPSRIKNRIA